jgi:putative peptide zinc metalloprotease protein
MQNAVPCLRADVAVRPFDAADGDCRFVVAVDDRHFLVSAAVAAVLEASRQPGTLASIAQRASARLGTSISPQQVAQLLRDQVPQVLFVPSSEPRVPTAPLRFRRIIARGDTLRPLLEVIARLFTQRWVILFAALFLVVESAVAARALTSTSYSTASAEVAAAAVLTTLGVLVHELGHLAACVKYRATHGGLGMGLYWCVPVFFAEVHGAWLLARRERAVVDAGGLYTQAVYVALLGATYLASGAPSVLAAIVCTHYLMLHTLNPVLKYDGYWLLSDLTGVHNLHQSVRKIAATAWHALCLGRASLLPPARHLALFSGFVAAAVAYFAYTLALLGDALASTFARTLESWASLAHTTTAGTAITSLRAAGETVWLAALLFMASGIAVLLARSLGGLARESSHDR